MADEKSYVGMANCFFCNEPKYILMDKRLKNTLPRNAIYDKEPCDKCKGYMEQGIIIISVRDDETDRENPYRTGGWWVVKEEAFKNIPMDKELKDTILRSRVVFMEDSVCEKIGLEKNKK